MPRHGMNGQGIESKCFFVFDPISQDFQKHYFSNPTDKIES
jgi:hypothetical protein